MLFRERVSKSLCLQILAIFVRRKKDNEKNWKKIVNEGKLPVTLFHFQGMEGDGSPLSSLCMVRAAELFPKPQLEKEDEKLKIPLTECKLKHVTFSKQWLFLWKIFRENRVYDFLKWSWFSLEVSRFSWTFYDFEKIHASRENRHG